MENCKRVPFTVLKVISNGKIIYIANTTIKMSLNIGSDLPWLPTALNGNIYALLEGTVSIVQCGSNVSPQKINHGSCIGSKEVQHGEFLDPFFFWSFADSGCISIALQLTHLLAVLCEFSSWCGTISISSTIRKWEAGYQKKLNIWLQLYHACTISFLTRLMSCLSCASFSPFSCACSCLLGSIPREISN